MSLLMPVLVLLFFATLPYWRRWLADCRKWLTWSVPILWGSWADDGRDIGTAQDRHHRLKRHTPDYRLIARLERELGLAESGLTCETCGHINLFPAGDIYALCDSCRFPMRLRELEPRSPSLDIAAMWAKQLGDAITYRDMHSIYYRDPLQFAGPTITIHSPQQEGMDSQKW